MTSPATSDTAVLAFDTGYVVAHPDGFYPLATRDGGIAQRWADGDDDVDLKDEGCFATLDEALDALEAAAGHSASYPVPHPHSVEELEFGRGPRLWDADPDVCCAAFQLGACSHTEDVDYRCGCQSPACAACAQDALEDAELAAWAARQPAPEPPAEDEPS